MELIERYLQAVGRRLPPPKQADILAELRSALLDKLEAQFGPSYSEDAVVQVLLALGPPDKVAAGYSAEGQYLIGPALYPTFKLVAGIVLAAVTGAQLLALVIRVIVGEAPVDWLAAMGGLVSSLPAALGMVGLVFALLQRYDVRPDLTEDEVFDPRQLPALEGTPEPVKRGELIFSVLAGGFFLAFLAQFAGSGAFRAEGIFANPVLDQLFGWVALALGAGLALDIGLLWQGRWRAPLRLAKLATDAFSLVVLFMLLQGHQAWLAAAGVTGFLDSVRMLSEFTPATRQVFGMTALHLALTVAFIVTAIEGVVQVYRLLRAGWAARSAAVAGR